MDKVLPSANGGMPDVVILIEDNLEKGLDFAEHVSGAGIKFVWIQLSSSHHVFDDLPSELKNMYNSQIRSTVDRYVPASRVSDAISEIIKHSGNVLIFLDWDLGDINWPGELKEFLRKEINQKKFELCTFFVQCYSSSVSEAESTALYLSPTLRHAASKQIVKKATKEAVSALWKAGLEAWRRCHHEGRTILNRLWPSEARDYFSNAHPEIPHRFDDISKDRYSAAMRSYLRGLLGRDAPATWLEDSNQAKCLHEALKTLVGAESAAHFGFRHRHKHIDAGTRAPTRGLSVGAAMLLLAAATRPNNNWVDEVVWHPSTALTDIQTPKQALNVIFSLVGDGSSDEREYNQAAAEPSPSSPTDALSLNEYSQLGGGLFSEFVTQEQPYGSAEGYPRGLVDKVSLEFGGRTLRIELAFDMSRPKSDRPGWSLQKYFRYETNTPGGSLVRSLKAVIDALSRSENGLDQWARLRIVPDGHKTVLEIMVA